MKLSFADKLMAVWESSRLCPKYIKTIIAHRESDIERGILPNYLKAQLPYLQDRLLEASDKYDAMLWCCPCCMKKNPKTEDDI
jgi:hypothetical protein